MDNEDGEPIAKATVCIVGEQTQLNEVIIKDYSENNGMSDALIKAGVIMPEVVQTIEVGFVTVNSFMLTEKFIAEINHVRG